MKAANIARHQGFTLVEMAIVMMISGLLLSGATSMLSVHMKLGKLQETKDNIQKIEKALQSYYVMNGHFPCPASSTAKQTDTDFGKAKDECFKPENLLTTKDNGLIQVNNPNSKIVITGLLPFRSLGMSDLQGQDGWGNIFQYAVTGSLTLASEFNQMDGAIDIVAEDGQSRLNPAHTAQYAVISSGPNKLGGHVAGQQFLPCPINTPETENCDNDSVFMDAQRMDGATGEGQSSAYDDIISYSQYDPDLQADGGLVIQYKGSCMKDFSKIQTEGDMPIGVETLAKDKETLRSWRDDTFVLCYSSRYSVKMAYPAETQQDKPQCPEQWSFIGYKFFAYEDDLQAEAGISDSNQFVVCAR